MSWEVIFIMILQICVCPVAVAGSRHTDIGIWKISESGLQYSTLQYSTVQYSIVVQHCIVVHYYSSKLVAASTPVSSK